MVNIANFTVLRILEKITERDKKIRYEATSDLLHELNKKEFDLNEELASKLSKAVLHKLYDEACEVSQLALRCLSAVVKILHQVYVVEMVIELCDSLLEGKEKQCEISMKSLKTILCEVPTSLVKPVLVFLTPKLIKGITVETNPEIKCACLDILHDVLHTYGDLVAFNHELLLKALLSQLCLNNPSVRKDCVSCITSLALNLSDDLLAIATAEILRHLKRKGVKPEISRTNIQMLGALSCAVGYRFGPQLRDTIPVLMNYCDTASEINEELCVSSFQALESFLRRCSSDISSFCDEILHVTLEFLSYDPNFTDNMEESIDDEGREEDQFDESDSGYTDDEDVSWKVRRAAAKCLAALIVSCPEMLPKLYVEACTKLIGRFEEREQSVKLDVFNTFIELLRQTRNVTKGQNEINESSPRCLLIQEVPNVIESINMQLREKSIKTKVGAFSVLKELAIVLPDSVAEHIGSLIPRIEKALCDKSSTIDLKIEAFRFTRLVLASHSSTVLNPYIKAILGPVLLSVGQSFHKVTAEALRVCREIVRFVRQNIEGSSFDFKPYVYPIYNAIMARLKDKDQDKEVKECAISCMGLVVSTFGDNIKKELPECLPILVDRMGNEITRLTAVKAFAIIAASPLHLDLSCVLEHLIAELTAFLRKANQILRMATLETLNALIAANGDKLGSAAYGLIIEEISTVIRDTDLHVAALALNLCSTMLADRNSTTKVGLTVRNKVFSQVITLVRSSLLQEQVLMAMQSFFAVLIHSADTSFDDLLGPLISIDVPFFKSGGSFSKQALLSSAQCVAVLCLAAGDQKCSFTVKMLATMLTADSTAYSENQHLSLLCLGEIGRMKDLSSHANIENIVSGYFQSPFEEINYTASYALGNIAVGNISRYLPFILDQIDDQQERQYLLIYSLKEAIVRQAVDKAYFQNSSVEKILNLLFNHCESEDEGLRNVVAESLGKIALIMPEKLVPELKARLTSPAAFTRAIVVSAVKYSITDRPEKIDEIIHPEISSFLILINDQDWHVRRAALQALSTAGLKKPTLLKGLLPELLPQLYDQTMTKTVEDVLEWRKAAFECIDTLLDGCLHQMRPSSFIVPYLISGLDDTYDVKLLCHLLLSKLAGKCPSAVLAVLDLVVDPLQKTIEYRPQEDAVKHEIDRNEDMIRSALSAIASLNRISGANYSRGFRILMNKIFDSSTLWEMFCFIRNEQASLHNISL
ncbi:Cullin-associated NEDD8-dissociated protein 1 [Heracleum sosnowskyi]|uniref:Cullin-associated NEDD8-dissociated protein 1 n=1 Tax=Heracleum sosnowskyi TaxID=360622 RepID=A0AAD8JEQ8_9APIA|nr:Cullin-associated NEDD8-dissociated protein 1 [Heracleum sosnowskyi]